MSALRPQLKPDWHTTLSLKYFWTYSNKYWFSSAFIEPSKITLRASSSFSISTSELHFPNFSASCRDTLTALPDAVSTAIRPVASTRCPHACAASSRYTCAASSDGLHDTRVREGALALAAPTPAPFCFRRSYHRRFTRSAPVCTHASCRLSHSQFLRRVSRGTEELRAIDQ